MGGGWGVGWGGRKLSVYKTVLIVLHDTDSMAVSLSTYRLSLIMQSDKAVSPPLGRNCLEIMLHF